MGLFREDSADSDSKKSKSNLGLSQTRANRKRSRVVGQSSAKNRTTKSKELAAENESLKKAMNQMQERYK